jgi:hypothetical protein
MIDTLRRLRSIVPRRVKLRLLIGSDQVRSFHRWKDPRAVIRLAEPLILARAPETTAGRVASALDHAFWTRAERRAWCSRLAPNFPLKESSTEIRDAIPGAPRDARRWDRIPALRGVITPVAKYIVAHNLYGFRKGPTRPPPPRPAPIPGGTLPPIDPANPTTARLKASLDRALIAAIAGPKPSGLRKSTPRASGPSRARARRR